MNRGRPQHGQFAPVESDLLRAEVVVGTKRVDFLRAGHDHQEFFRIFELKREKVEALLPSLDQHPRSVCW